MARVRRAATYSSHGWATTLRGTFMRIGTVKLVVKWDLDNRMPMVGEANLRISSLIDELGYEGLLMKIKSRPTADDPVKEVGVDKELGRQAFVYVLKSGAEGTIHIDQVWNATRNLHICGICCCTG
jgi:hypothetical protein